MSSAIDATPDINKIAAEVIVSATEATVRRVASPTQTALRRLLQTLSNAYQPYLTTTFQRVRTIKTFLKPNEPIDLLSNYVAVHLSDGDKDILVDGLLGGALKGGRIVISATAGRGKSVLMRYLAVSLYHAPRGKIPIFLELRFLNQMSAKDILAYLHSQYKGNTSIQFPDFIEAVKKGYFIFLFDGFDELDPSARSEVESQILHMAAEYPHCPIIISGRPDDRFYSWEQFKVLKICPMSYSQVRKLISQADYDVDVKKQFLKRLTSDFYDRHDSFLSTPLLAILLMLTFEEYAEIPTSLHVFYNNAFETLVRRHDAMKAQFLRTMHSQCSAEDFRRIFSSLSLLTYSKAKYQFTYPEMREYLSLAIRQQQIKADPNHVLADLIESVCLLQKEGFEITFVHRSFQEYFCALFVAQAPSGLVSRYLDSGKFRTYDSVLPMLYGMAQERVEQEWVKPRVAEIQTKVARSKKKALDIILEAFPSLNFDFYGEDRFIVHMSESKLGRDLSILNRLYPAHFRGSGKEERRERNPREVQEYHSRVLDMLLRYEESGDPRFVDFSTARAASSESARTGDWRSFQLPVTAEDAELLGEVGFIRYGETIVKALRVIGREVDKRAEEEDLFLAKVFSPEWVES